LASLLDMNRDEKEQYVIQLYKENKSMREIAKLTHMSFSRILAIKKKAKLEADGERGQLGEEDDDNIKSKSKATQAIAMFSDLKSPVEVAVALDLPVDQVITIYREYLELDGMGKLTQIYEEVKYDLRDLLGLHKLVKDHGMEKQDIINVLEFVRYNELRTLQRKAANLGYQIDKLETEKVEAMKHLLKLKTMIGESENTLAQKRSEITQMDQGSKSDNTDFERSG
jgi:hypothetical protein